MKRFYGTAIFEGEEVADSAFTQLQNIRAEEQRRVDAAENEFEQQINELNFWRADELAFIDADAHNQIDVQTKLIAQYRHENILIRSNANSAIVDTQAQYNSKQTSEATAAIAKIEADAEHQISIRNGLIAQCQRQIAQIKSDRSRLIARVHADYAHKYNAHASKRDKEITRAHSDATDQIAAVIARRYYDPVFMLRCAKGPCDFCRAKYGTIGTHGELLTLACIPPFHDDCRCWLEEVGYVVRTY